MASKVQQRQRVAFGVTLGLAALAVLLLTPPVLAQYDNIRSPFDSFWGTFSSPRPTTPTERPVDSSRAPAPKKAETPPTSTVLVLGDSMADWLAYGLEDAFADMPEVGVVRKHRTASGLVRYDTRSETLDWAQVAREAITADKPNFIIMMLGVNDRQAIRERQTPSRPGAQPTTAPGAAPPATQPTQQAPPQSQQADAEKPADQGGADQPASEPQPRGRGAVNVHEFRSERWTELYTKRIDDTIAAMKSRGVPVFWVGLPSLRGPRATSDAIYLNELFRARAEKAGISYIDVWDGFVDEGGRFNQQGADFEGQIRRLRTGDGLHFTKPGARKLAHYVEREIRRLASRGPVPVALPQSEPTPQAPQVRPGGPTARPLSGPVVPLTANAAVGEGLLGGETPTAPGHVTATRVLVRGEAVHAPAGRGDDFSWPRRGIAEFGADPVVATTTLPIPVMRALPAATTVPVPVEEATAVAAAPVRRAQAVPRPHQPTPQRPSAPQFPSFFPFFR